MTPLDEFFRECARLQAELMGWAEPQSDEDFRWYFDDMLRSKGAHSAGFICKFARWQSVPECWEYKKPHFFLEKPVLVEMGGGGVDNMLDDIKSNQTSMQDSELAVKLTSDKKGLLKRCPGYINMKTAQHLEVLTCCTRPLSRYHSHRTS